MYLAGDFDTYPGLKILLAHSGGTLPFLAGRLRSCIAHDRHLVQTGTAPTRPISEVLSKNLWLDAVIYSSAGLMAAAEASGAQKLMFGTDSPFFPALAPDETEWMATPVASQPMLDSFRSPAGVLNEIIGGNAVELPESRSSRRT